MIATLEFDYSQIRNLVFQMPLDDRRRLSEELSRTTMASEPEISFGPKNREEAVMRLKQSIADVEAGNVEPVKDFIAQLRKEYPWASK